MSKSPNRQSYRRKRSRSKSASRQPFNSSVCNIDCQTSTQFNEQKAGPRHRESAASADQSSKPVTFSLNNEPKPIASFGKVYCSWCKRAADSEHFHCNLCQVHSTSKVDYDMHVAGKRDLSLSYRISNGLCHVYHIPSHHLVTVAAQDQADLSKLAQKKREKKLDEEDRKQKIAEFEKNWEESRQGRASYWCKDRMKTKLLMSFQRQLASKFCLKNEKFSELEGICGLLQDVKKLKPIQKT